MNEEAQTDRLCSERQLKAAGAESLCELSRQSPGAGTGQTSRYHTQITCQYLLIRKATLCAFGLRYAVGLISDIGFVPLA